MCVYKYMHADIHETNEKPYRQKRIYVYIYKKTVYIYIYICMQIYIKQMRNPIDKNE